MKNYFLGLILIVFGCTSIENKYVCNCEEAKRAADFVATNLKASNNMSDEEMEDVIIELRRTGILLNCHQRQFICDQNGYPDWSCPSNKLDSCEVYPFDLRRQLKIGLKIAP